LTKSHRYIRFGWNGRRTAMALRTSSCLLRSRNQGPACGRSGSRELSKTRTAFAFALLVIAPALPASHPAQMRTTAAQELDRLQGPDAARYASALYDDDHKWSFVSSKIATGEQDWLQVAKLLVPIADGALAEDLRSNLASALLVRPANILKLLKTTPTLKPADVCNAPFPSPGKTWLTRYRARAIKSVGAVREPSLRRLRDDCLKVLRRVDLTLPPEDYE